MPGRPPKIWRQKFKLCVIRLDSSFWQPSQTAICLETCTWPWFAGDDGCFFHLGENLPTFSTYYISTWLVFHSPAGSHLTDWLSFPSPRRLWEAADLVQRKKQITFYDLIGRPSKLFGSVTGGGCCGTLLQQKHCQWRQSRAEKTAEEEKRICFIFSVGLFQRKLFLQSWKQWIEWMEGFLSP